MEDISKLCKGCMKSTASGGKCPECGFDEARYTAMPHHLKPGTILAGKYMIGKKLGEGGFGITYIGIDLNLGLRAAIKEYFPVGFVTRDTSHTDTLTVFDGSSLGFFERGRDKFIEEARTIAHFNDSDGIVSVKDFFLENGTAYIVMEYLEGETLKNFLERTGGKMNVPDALNMIKPVMSSLIQLHKSGLIHRDISPDNIMLTKTGKVKLIDFGAARNMNPQGSKSLSIQLKPGYAPEEQYRTHGNQGPWTDVYALCATIYRMITGTVPEEANERLVNDTLAPPSALGAAIDPETENAVMRGLSVRAENRLRSVSELYDVLYRGAALKSPPPYTPENTSVRGNSGWKTAVTVLSATAVTAAVLIVVFMLLGRADDTPPAAESPAPTAAATAEPTQTPAPTAAPTQNIEIRERPDLYSANLEYKRMPEIHSSVLVSDTEFNALKSVILDFDKKCVEYMNNGSPEIFVYLAEGTTAYEQQTEYKEKHGDIYEILNYADVINARSDGESYYVWVTEDMTVTENGETSNTVDHWVYRIKASGGKYIITDYTRDPLYN